MRRIELTPHQERILADAAAAMPAPVRSDFLTDVRSRLGDRPSNAAVWAAINAAQDWFRAQQQPVVWSEP